jgi:acetyltransferase-like isoleucine patch superfamily enzyme
MFISPVLLIRDLYQRVFGKPSPPPSQVTSDPFFTSQNANYVNYQIGEWTYGKPKVFSWDESTKLTIGKFCSIADGVTIILGGEHRTDWITTYPFNVLFEEAKCFEGHPRTKGDVMIGNDVWIGTDAFILSGVTIGDGAVIAARSVVTKNVAAYSIVAGNPARHLRFRFPEDVIEALEKICWWDWPISEVQKAWGLLLSSEIEAFLAKYGEGTFRRSSDSERTRSRESAAAV